MTDNKIVKALKEILELMCIEGDLQRSATISNALDLINRLQAENERLFADNQKYLSVMLWGNKKHKKDCIKQIKAEAYKECIEKVKENSNKMDLVCSGALVKRDYTITEETLDNLSKELVGDADA